MAKEGQNKVIDITDKTIFLSGPMTGHDHYNVAEFSVAHNKLKNAGAKYVYNPAIRHLSMGNDKRKAMKHEDYLTDTINELTKREKRSQGWELIILRKYDMLVLLDGWEESEGSYVERAVAVICGIEVCTLGEVLL